MWMIYAFASAIFAGLTSVLAKVGIKNVDSNLATALRTIVVVIFAWLIVLIVGSYNQLSDVSTKSLIFLVLSGLATGASWLCYFRALHIGDINKVVPIDKSSTVLTMLLAFIFLHESLSFIKVISMVLIAIGTYLMIEPKENMSKTKKRSNWLIYAFLSAVFASLTAILGKVGIENVDSNLGTAIRTLVVLIMAWMIVFARGKHKEIDKIDKRSWLFIFFSGLTTGLSWLCYYKALQGGPASVVVPIDKLSILISVAFGYGIFKEKLKIRAIIGLVMIVSGTLMLL